jgi:CBS domain-containing protein
MTVKAILAGKSGGIFSVRPEATLEEVSRELTARRIGAVLVMDGDRLAGILSERDIVRSIGARGADGLSSPLSEVMTRKVTTCTEETTVHEAMEMMTSGRFRHLPVCRHDQLIGIVSIGDVVKRRIEDAVGEAEAMRDYIAASG